MDSLGLFMSLNVFTVLQIAKIYSLPQSQSVLQIHKMSVQQQQGTLDCGLFAIAFAVEVCSGRNPQCASFTRKNVSISIFVLQKECLRPFQKYLKTNVHLLWFTKLSFTVSNAWRIRWWNDILWYLSRMVSYYLCAYRCQTTTTAVELLPLQALVCSEPANLIFQWHYT